MKVNLKVRKIKSEKHLNVYENKYACSSCNA